MLNPSVDTSNNQLSSSDNYDFDNVGNTTEDAQGRTFIYDAENKQVSISDTNGLIGEYFYDGDGKRVKKYVPDTAETTIFVYDAAGKLVAEYSTIVASSNDAQVAYLTNDHLGSARVNTDKNGHIVARHDYHPFGEEIATSQRISGLGYAGDSVRKQFTGYERDIESSLDFAQARMYNPMHGRFTAVDPLLASGMPGNPQTWNRYPYVLGNPLRLVDPTGKSPSTHIDENGKVVAVIDDGDLGVYQHKNNADGKAPTEYMIQKRQQNSGSTAAGGTKIGQTVIWHEFREHDKAGNPTSKIAKGAQIVRGLDFLPVVNEINQAARQETLGAVMDLSKNRQPFDIKTNTTLAPYGPNTGGLLGGNFVTARSAGNFLAGMNGANVSTNSYVNDYFSLDALMRVSGEYEQTQKMDATTVVGLRSGAISPTVNVAPFYGESSYSGLYIMAGYEYGKSRR
ncbi:MAG: RHS repeat-associated core domain-containing protein [Acidobacteriota bacterium]